MTVGELQEKLRELPDDLVVVYYCRLSKYVTPYDVGVIQMGKCDADPKEGVPLGNVVCVC